MYRHFAFLVSIITVLMISPIAHAQWVENGALVTAATDDQFLSKVASDGAGGAIVVWSDERSGTGDIYAQRLDAYGNPMWLADGIPIRTDAALDIDPVIASDGMGGAIIAWESFGTQKVGMQRVDADGNILWTADGVTIEDASGSGDIRVISDGAGGGIVTWVDFRDGLWHPFVQRVDAGGSVLWTNNGVKLCNAAVGQLRNEIVSDGAGGAIVTWQDIRGGATYDIYAQSVDATGAVQWTADGVAVCTAATSQVGPSIATDGQGGAFIAWEDPRGVNEEVYVQRIGYTGNVLWAADGIPITAITAFVSEIRVLPDGAGGTIIVWIDSRNTHGDIFAQRVDNVGTTQWTANGEAVCTSSENQYGLAAIPDGAGGAIMTWLDARNLVDEDIYAMRIDSFGFPLWSPNGLPVALDGTPGGANWPSIASDGAGGAVISYSKGSNPNMDVYAQRMERNGYWGYPAANAVSANDVAGDQGGLVSLEWDASRLDPWPEEKIDNYTLWRAINLPSATALLDQGVPLIDKSDNPHAKMKSAIRAEASAAGSSYWELVGSQDAYGLSTYSKLVSTTGDSTSVSPSFNYFQIIAHNGTQAWISNSVGGYSLDNLSPAAPLLLVASRVGDDVQLDWNASGAFETDFSHYAVYRKESSGVNPVLINFLASAADTTLLDENADPGTQYFYVVTAVDEHENESDVSNEVVADIVTAVGGGENTPAFSTLTLLNNMPNPFSASGTTIRFGMPEAADVSVEFYDIAGRRVATRRVAGASVGENSLRFNGFGDSGRALPSGIYFYRVSGAGATAVGKLSIVR